MVPGVRNGVTVLYTSATSIQGYAPTQQLQVAIALQAGRAETAKVGDQFQKIIHKL